MENQTIWFMHNWWHESYGPTPIQAWLLNKKKNQKMCLPGLEPRHGQRWGKSLTTQLSLQVDAQQ